MSAKKTAPREIETGIGVNSPILACTPKRLPMAEMVAAADHACQVNPLNSAPVHRLARVMRDFAPTKEHLAVITTKYWGIKGVNLSVAFLDGESSALRRLILKNMNAWSEFANVLFRESGNTSSADVRIARMQGNEGGYWSYLGTDIQLIEAGMPTMNLEGFTENTPESEFRRVVRHEAGHTLGFPHEHMRAELVAKIDPAKAIEYFGRTQGWTPQEVHNQVLTPLEESSLLGTQKGDPFSIMCYQISSELTFDGKPIIGGTDIDQDDREFASKIYPKPEDSTKDGADSETSITYQSNNGIGGGEDAAIIEILPNSTRITLKRPGWSGESAGNYMHLAAAAENITNNSDFCTTAGRNAFKAQNRTPDGKVTFIHVDKRTRAMLFCQHGLTNINPTAPLLTPAERVQLKGPINAGWFDDVGCNISNSALNAADTLNKLENAIYDACANKA